MSFFDKYAFDGKKVDGSAEQSNVQANDFIPGGTRAIANIEEFKWNEFQGKRTIRIRWKLIDGDFKGRVTFQKIDLEPLKDGKPDEKKAFRQANVLKRLFMLTGATIPDNEPTDADFAQMVGSMAGIAIEVWASIGRDGQPASGNWISEIHPTQGFECVTGNKEPKLNPSQPGGSGGNQSTPVDEPLW